MNTMQHTKDWKRKFFPFWISQMLSLLGSALVQFSLVWWLTKETGSATVLSIASMFAVIPEIIIQPFAGAITDRIDRKKIIIIADALIALFTLLLGVLFFIDKVEVWHIYGIMMLRAIGGAFHYPAEQASVSLMVPNDQLARISGLNQAAKGIINLVSAPLGALLMEVVGVEGSLFVDVITALIAVGVVVFTVIPRQKMLEENNGSWFGTVLQDMRDGLRYLLGWKGMMVMTVMALVFKIALSPAFALLPLYVSDHFNGSAAEYSLLQVVAGIGIILGGVLLGAWGGFKKKIYTIMLGGIGLGTAFIILAFLPASAFYISMAPAFVIGFMIPMIDGPLHAILQEKVDNEYQGRVMTMFGSLIYLSTPIGLAIAGPLSDRVGIRIWFILAGILIILAKTGGLFFKAYRNIEEDPVVNPNGKDEKLKRI